MNKVMEKLYRQAKRFDEGEIYQSREYKVVWERKLRAWQKMYIRFGPSVIPVLEEYAEAAGDESELENQHFFEQGCRSAGEREERWTRR